MVNYGNPFYTFKFALQCKYSKKQVASYGTTLSALSNCQYNSRVRTYTYIVLADFGKAQNTTLYTPFNWQNRARILKR